MPLLWSSDALFFTYVATCQHTLHGVEETLCAMSSMLGSVGLCGALQHALQRAARNLLQLTLSAAITMPCQQHIILPTNFSLVVELLSLPSETDQMKLHGMLSPLNRTACKLAGGEGAERCVTQSGARGVAVSTQRAAQPYEFAYDHVSGELGSQDDLFMCKHMLCACL